MTEPGDRNPFVGPRPLRRGEPLFGRDAELEQLCDLLRARRVVVLHGPAGVGKSSLVHAGVAQRMLDAGFDVWKPIRLSCDPARHPELARDHNPCIVNALVELEDELPAARRRAPAELARLELGEYVKTRPRRRKRAEQSVVLVFDQVEALLTSRTSSDESKREFFAAVGRALEDEERWALFVVRDEQLARLTLFQSALPTGLSNTFHVDLLDHAGAREAIERTAATGGRSIAQLDALLRGLSRVNGSIDPLHLQVSCRRLWHATPSDAVSIDATRLGPCDPADVALARYYAEVVHDLADRELEAERALREWLAEALLVNGSGVATRRDAASIAEPVLRSLIANAVLRADESAGVEWLELGHERLADAIAADNDDWSESHPRVLARLQELIPPWSKPGERSLVGELGEDSWVITELPNERSASLELTARRPHPAFRLSPVDRSWFAQLGKALLDADPRSDALLAAALACLGAANPQWVFLAAPIRSLDHDALLTHLQPLLDALVDAQAYAGMSEYERPTPGDLVVALLELGRALASARGPRKRELLVAAFRAGFRVEYFTTGMTPHLWDIACRIEHPELRQLETMLEAHVVGEEIAVHASDHGAFFVAKLVALGLVREVAELSGVVVATQMAATFCGFVQAG